jgi:hypothetical protein
VDSRFSAENATRQKEHFPEKWTSGFPQKMRPGKTNPKTNPMQSPGSPGALFIATRRAARIAASLLVHNLPPKKPHG